MDTLRIHCFGGLRVSRGDRELPAFPTQKSRALFAFLAVHRGRSWARDVLVGHFWGDSPETVARKNLRNDLWRIRGVVEGEGAPAGSCVAVRGDDVRFNVDGDYWLDVQAFEAALDAAGADGAPCDEAGAEALRRAVHLYRGDLLDGMYDDWCLFERERLRLRYVRALERLIAHHRERGEWGEAALQAQRLLARDPLREHVHRDLMRCYAALGDPAAALRQYDLCARLLRQELDAAPREETRAVRDEVRCALGDRPASPPAMVAVPAVFPGDDLLDRLRAAARWADETSTVLHRAIRDLEGASV